MENGNLPIFISENGKVVHISVDFGHKEVKEAEISFAVGRKTKICTIIVTVNGNHRS